MTRPISVVAATDTEPEAPADAAPGSVLHRLRAQSAEQQRDRTVEVEIGGAFSPPIVAVYGVLGVEELERYAELAEHTGNVELALDMLARTNRSLWSADGERKVQLRDERGAVTYSHRLAVLLGMPIPPGMDELPPREVILMLFGRNAFQLGAHATQVITWMQNPGGPAPGESSGATG